MNHSEYIGSEKQLFGVDEYRAVGGRADGMRLLRVRNGLGLDVTLSADRCLDISDLFFDGIRMNYVSPCGMVSPVHYDAGKDGTGFLRSFNCGMMTTCGLGNIGPACEDEGIFHPLHGTIANVPGDHVYYEITDDEILVHATMYDQVIFGTKFAMRRTIHISLTEDKLRVEDEVKNEGTKDEPVMLLYHINFGYPLLSEHAILKSEAARVVPRDARAAEDADTWNQMIKPVPNFDEQCYYHEFEGDTGVITLENAVIGKALTLSFPRSSFPLMTEWKMMGVRDYVLGMEPCTNYLHGRHEERKTGQVVSLAPGESKHYEVTFTCSRV